MSRIKVLIVEDEQLTADLLEMLVEKLGYEHLTTLENSGEVLAQLEKKLPDLILMDIHIHGTYDGIELTEMIHRKHDIPVIFITSQRDELTFNRASRTKAVHFIIKPFDELQLQRAIELTVQRLIRPQAEEQEWKEDVLFQEQFFIKNRNRLEKVNLSDILYIEANGNHCGVHLQEKKYLLRMSLSHLTDFLPSDRFLQTHRSYVVNKEKIEFVDLDDGVIHVGTLRVPISTRNRDRVISKLGYIN